MAKKSKKAKSAKRVAAGKKAWAAKSAAQKASVISRLRGRATKAAKAAGTKVRKMAKKGGGGNRRQGIVSWVRALLTLFIAFFYPVRLLMSGDVDQFTHDATMGLSSGGFDKEAALRMYGPMGGALVFHQITGELNRRVKMNSLIPALHA